MRRRDRLAGVGSWVVYVPLAPLVLVQLTMRSRWPGIYNLYNDWANVAYYSVFLVAGFLLACHPALERLVERERKRSLALGGLATTALLIAVLGMVQSPTILLIGSAVAGWCFVIALLGIGRRYCTTSGPRLTYLSESAFPVYVLHQAGIVFPGYFIIRLPLGIAAKFALLLAVSVTVTLAMYHWLVRPFAASRLLLGMRPKVYPLRRPVALAPSAAALLALVTVLGGRASAATPVGVWYAEGGAAQFAIEACGEELCGQQRHPPDRHVPLHRIVHALHDGVLGAGR